MEFAKDERKRSRTAKSCGPDAPVAGVKFAMMLRITRATVANKPGLAGESTKETVKPLRREGRTASAEPVCSCAFFVIGIGTRDRGCSAHPVFPAPSRLRVACALYFLGRMNLQYSGASCRENAEAYSIVVPAQAGTQYSEPSVMDRKVAAYWIPAFAGMTTAGHATLSRKASSAASTASGVPTCIHTPSNRSPNRRSCSLA